MWLFHSMRLLTLIGLVLLNFNSNFDVVFCLLSTYDLRMVKPNHCYRLFGIDWYVRQVLKG